MAGPKIRIKLRAYDHRMLDFAARDIVEHVQRTGAKVVRRCRHRDQALRLGMGDVKGIVGEKVGMTQIFVETRAVPVTVIKAGPCVVAQVKTKEVDGYDAVQLA